jgi:hypothetical protein
MSSGTREDYGEGRKKMESLGLGDGQPGIWMGAVLCDFNVNRQLSSRGLDGCRRTRRHQPISSEQEHKLTHSAVNVTPNPTPFVDDAVTDLSTSKSTVSDLRL